MQIKQTFGEKIHRDKKPSVVLHLSRSYEASIQNADVVVTTPSAACQFWTRGSFKPSHIIIDGASQIIEPVLWPILTLAAKTANFVAMILLGDDVQVPRLAMTDSKKCKFKDQLEISLFHRLITSGLCLPSLRQQRRMHKDIAACPNRVFYESRLNTHTKTTDVQWNKMSYCIAWFNSGCFRITHNVLVIDNPDSKQKVDDSGSSVNEENAKLVVSLVTRLLKMLGSDLDASSITILTFYNAQKQLHERNMKRLQHEKPELNADKIGVSTVDSFQGHEADIVILDFVVVDRPGFVTDKARLACALTRAKSGLYMITSIDAINQACAEIPRPKGKYLKTILREWIVRKIVVDPDFFDKQFEAWVRKRAENAAKRKAIEAGRDTKQENPEVGSGL
ncbi:hypothetical protein N7528_009402 [Penicillium herquei]|nr:hypothetical protein N7528_009402 [Penicillium herquei]